MPTKPVVDDETIFQLLVKDYDKTQLFRETDNQLLPPRMSVWENISEKLNFLMSKKYIWQYLHDNRYGVTTKVQFYLK